MRIGVDIRPLQLQHRVRGIGMHAKALMIELLLNKGSDDEIVLYMYPHLPDPIKEIEALKHAQYRVIHLKNYKEALRFLPDSIAASIALFRRVLSPLPDKLVKQVDVLLAFDFMNGMPRKRSVKYVLIGYDLIPLLYRRDYFPPFRANWRGGGLLHAMHAWIVAWLYEHAVSIIRKRQFRILSISESTKEHFVSIAHIRPEYIRTVYLGNPLASNGFKTEKTSLGRVRGFKKNSYILFIGGNDPRRRLQDVVGAFNQLRGRGYDLKLVFAGFDFQRLDTIVSYRTRRAIETSSYIDDIHLLGFINDSEKKYLYENALCFAFPTICEGFGLPVLEAMQEECPVIAYDYPLSSIAEVSGDAALLIDPGIEPVYGALRSLIENPNLGPMLIKKGLDNVRRFSWEKCAEETVSALKDPTFLGS